MMEPRVIYEGQHFLVVNKPAGLQVHPARIARGHRMAQGPTVVDWLLSYYPEVKTVGDDPSTRPGIVHRLDKETSGVMIVARDQKGFDYLKDLFQKHEIKKTYLAVVRGEFKQKKGTIDAAIGLRNGTTKRTVRGGRMAKPAITEYKVVGTLGKPPDIFSVLEVYPQTGRTHQIRVHLASIGHPIIGDVLYGARRGRGGKSGNGLETRMMLHALSIEFTAPDGKRVKFESEPLGFPVL